MASKESIPTVPIESESKEKSSFEANAYGYAFPYKSFSDAKFLAALLKENLGIRYNSVPIVNSGKSWERGSIFILKGDNLKNESYLQKLEQLATQYDKVAHRITTGYSIAGPDLGADEIHLIKPPKIAVLRTDNASTYSYGEIWHYF